MGDTPACAWRKTSASCPIRTNDGWRRPDSAVSRNQRGVSVPARLKETPCILLRHQPTFVAALTPPLCNSASLPPLSASLPSLFSLSLSVDPPTESSLLSSAGGVRRHRAEDAVPVREQQATRGPVRGPPGDRKDDEREDHRRQVCVM